MLLTKIYKGFKMDFKMEGMKKTGLNSIQKVKQTTPADVALLLSPAGLHAITAVTALSADSMLHNT